LSNAAAGRPRGGRAVAAPRAPERRERASGRGGRARGRRERRGRRRRARARDGRPRADAPGRGPRRRRRDRRQLQRESRLGAGRARLSRAPLRHAEPRARRPEGARSGRGALARGDRRLRARPLRSADRDRAARRARGSCVRSGGERLRRRRGGGGRDPARARAGRDRAREGLAGDGARAPRRRARGAGGAGAMLIFLTEYLTRFYTGFNVFSYLTMRAILGALTALVLSFALGPYLIQRLSMRRIGQQVRDLGPESHLPKAGTPTMGGALILL